MWYRNHIGQIFECESIRNLNTLFVSYTDCICSYRTLHPIKTKMEFHYKTITLANGIEKYIRCTEPQFEEIQVQGWILDEDVDVLDMREEILQ